MPPKVARACSPIQRSIRCHLRGRRAHARIIRRTGRHEMWKREDALAAKTGTTRKPDLGREGEDIHIMIEGERSLGRTTTGSARSAAHYAQLLCEEKRHHTPRTRCIAIWMQRAPQGHTDACRTRIMELLRPRPQTRARVESGGAQGCQIGTIHGAAGPGEETAGSEWSRGIGPEWRAIRRVCPSRQ